MEKRWQLLGVARNDAQLVRQEPRPRVGNNKMDLRHARVGLKQSQRRLRQHRAGSASDTYNDRFVFRLDHRFAGNLSLVSHVQKSKKRAVSGTGATVSC